MPTAPPESDPVMDEGTRTTPAGRTASPATVPPTPLAPYTVSVRTLCDLTARHGDLDLRFTPGPTALEGIEGHQRVVARRGKDYEAEVSLEATLEGLRVRGRADGFDPVRGRLEEIKTHRGDLARQPAHHRTLHRAQLRCYGAMLCADRQLPRLRLALVYLDIGSGDETVIEEEAEAAALQAEFEGRCRAFAAWAAQEATHRAARDQALAPLPFPHAGFRAGQRELAAAVWRASQAGRPLMAEAPTGIGKTVATLYPALRAMPGLGLEKLFFVTAKTPGRQLALHALRTLRAGGAQPLRVLELTARDKACEHPDKACHGESCPLAQGFYDRLPAARQAALAEGALEGPALRALARQHAVCPYWLAQDLMRWCDVVVGDYNHFFDTSAALHALALESEGRCTLLVDEAHNLVDRARQMYTATLDEDRWRGLRREAVGPLRTAVQKLLKAWRDLTRDLAEDFTPLPELPEAVVRALAACTGALAEAMEGPGPVEAGLQEAYFEGLAWLRLAERFGAHSCVDITREGSGRQRRTALTLRNLLPAPHLQARWTALRTAVLFSATLGPAESTRDLLGLPEDAAWVDIPSPFRAEQLSVRLVPQVSTRWADRPASIAPIARLIASQWAERPGNYLAFFSSYDYLSQVAAELARAHPEIPHWLQSRRMTEADREAFLARFQAGGQGVGFAVLGGAFGEGIDLPGDRLVGAFVATLGLPQVNPVNEKLRECLQAAFGRGFEDAYLIPGMRKVVQAAGRVIRTPQDQGVVYLIDPRFGRPDVRALLPRWWAPARWPHDG